MIFKKGDLVKCVNNYPHGNGEPSNLTINKSYKIIGIFNLSIYVTNDLGNRNYSYRKDRFVLDIEKIRNETIDNILS